jgi:tyrosine-protein phosphatase SIW14
MKRYGYSIVGLLLVAAPVVSQQSDAAKNAALASPETKINATAPRPVIAIPAEKLNIAGVHNAGKISDALFRGGQPSTQGLAELKKLGVTTIVDLRGNRGEVNWERRQSEMLRMHFVNISVRGWSTPTDAQVAQFLKLFEDKYQKVFVHCRYGEDRTGVMVAAYRIAEQKWTADQALREMNSFGFHYHWYRGMRAYVRSFPENYASQAAFATLRRSPTGASAAAP